MLTQLRPVEETVEFDYLADRIRDAQFSDEPFRHIVVENFLSDAHFALVTGDPQVALAPASSSRALIHLLVDNGYKLKQFPGCTADVETYLAGNQIKPGTRDGEYLEGFGLTFRLYDIRNEAIRRLIGFLNSPAFHLAIQEKYGITRPNRIETAIQKYLSGYEISPHPDIRSKCATYLLNINTDPRADALPIHTHLLKFKPQKRFIYSFWEENPDADRCWVPWDWCTSQKQITQNNSMVLFEAHNRSLHAIKLTYDHLPFQRTQIYGNLWYTDIEFEKPWIDYRQFDIRPRATDTKPGQSYRPVASRSWRQRARGRIARLLGRGERS